MNVPSDIDKLVQRHAAATITRAEMDTLEAWLREDPSHIEWFASYGLVEQGLLTIGRESTANDLMGALAEIEEAAPPVALVDLTDELKVRRLRKLESKRARSRRMMSTSQADGGPIVISKLAVVLAAAAVLGLIAWLGWPDAKPAASSDPTAQQGDPDVPRTLAPATNVAFIRSSVDASWGGLAYDHNHYLRSGKTVTLRAGLAEVVFGDGAAVIIEGPATFEPTGPNAMRLDSGQIVATVPPSAVGFIVQTHDARVVDVGTEFGIEATRGRPSYLAVFRGKVYASRATDNPDDPDGVSRVAVVGGQTLSIEPGGAPLTQLVEEAVPGELRFARSLDREALADLAYARAVLADEPAAYWRFSGESRRDALTSQAAGREYLSLVGDARVVSDGGRGWLEINPNGDADPSYAEFTHGYAALSGAEAYTIECWARPREWREAAVVSLYAMQPGQASALSAMILHLHDPDHPMFGRRTVRFVHRNPPAIEGPTEAVDATLYPPDQWLHLVAVKTRNELRLYVNGQWVATQADRTPMAEMPLRLLLGHHYTDDASNRQYRGAIDEVAFYRRALTEAELAAHYEAGQRDD